MVREVHESQPPIRMEQRRAGRQLIMIVSACRDSQKEVSPPGGRSSLYWRNNP